MRRSLAVIAGTCCLMAATGTQAQTLSVGVAAPLSGPNALLGRQISAGAEIAAKNVGAEVTTADDLCTAAGGQAAARRLADAKVNVVVGFLCTEAIEAALPILMEARIPVITVGVRTESLTDLRAKTGWIVFRLGPRGDDERSAAATMVAKLWRDDLFAIVDDGTIYGRELAESVRNAAEQVALKPVFIDTYRPDTDNQIGLVARLKRAGAARVFVGGEGRDVAIMGRDAANLDAETIFAGGETLRVADAEIPYAPGTLMIALPEWADIADRKVLEAFKAAGVFPEGYVLPAYAAVQVAHDAAEAAAREGGTLAEKMPNRDFDTAIGPIRFDEKGDLTANPYRLFRFTGGQFVAVVDNGQ